MHIIQKNLDKIFGLKSKKEINGFDYKPKDKLCWHNKEFQSRPEKLNGMYGKKHSKETLKKISNSKKGQIAFTYKWKITTPDGKLIIRNNLHEYCRDNKLNMSNLTYHGHTKGYKAVRV